MANPSDETQFSARIKAELSTVPDVDGWPELATRLAASPARMGPSSSRRGPIRSGRLMAALVAGILIVLIGSASALAATTGVLSDWMRAVGLVAAGTPTPVSVSATQAGITIKATEAYRDSHVIALGLEIDDPAATGRAEDWMPSSAMVTGAGTHLQLVDSHPQGGKWLVVFVDPTGGQIEGNAVTMTIPQLMRFTDPTRSKTSTLIDGPWTLRLDLRGSTSPGRQLTSPAAGQVGQVRVTFLDVGVSGSYVALRVDIAELAPGAFNGPQPVPGQADRFLGTDFQVVGPGGKPIEPVASLGDTNKGDILPSTAPRTYHQGYLFARAGSGTYKLLVHSGGQTMERLLQVP
jgi:hypothetical protein